MSDFILLTALWALPLAGSLAVLAVPRRFEPMIRGLSLATCLLTLLLALFALKVYFVEPTYRLAPIDVSLETRARVNQPVVGVDGRVQVNDAAGDLVACAPWIRTFNIQYFVGLDGISLALVLLTAVVATLSCLASWTIDRQAKAYFSLFLLLLASLMGVFLALDLILFYIFFELMLLPMYFLIGVWGGERREYAAMKFLLYTLLGSVFILVAILLLYFWSGDAPWVEVYDRPFRAHTFDMVRLASAATTSYYGLGVQQAIFVLFLIGFLVKLPSFPFHTWLPDAHVEAPTPISMMLAGVLLKVGGYGMLRLAWPLAPAGAQSLAWYVSALGVFSILYGALAAMAQTDFKRLVAYSSVSHMGYVTLGLGAMRLMPDPSHYAYGVGGALFMMLAHGVTSTAMFFLVGVIYDRAHTRDLNALGGLFHPMPGYAAVSTLIFFGAMGLPGLCGFVAEVFVILSAFHYSIPVSVLAALAVVLTAGYVLWTLQRVFLGRNEQWTALPDLNAREWTIAAPLVALTILLGVFPQQIVLEWAGPSIRETVARITAGSVAAENQPRVALQGE